VTFRSFPA